MSLLDTAVRAARRMLGVQIIEGRELQLRAETLFLYNLITRSFPYTSNSLRQRLSHCADLVEEDLNIASKFEEQAAAVISHLHSSTAKVLSTVDSVRKNNCLSVDVKREHAKDLVAHLRKTFGYVPVVRQSSVSNSGLGLHLEGRAPEGALIALYPGTCYLPSDLRHLPHFPNISKYNDYLIWRYDGIVIDAMDACDEVESQDQPCDKISETVSHYPSQPLSPDSPQKLLHPFAQGHRVNHPPQGCEPNCMQFMLNINLRKEFSHLQAEVPNVMFQSTRGERKGWIDRLQNAGVRRRVASSSVFAGDQRSGSIPTLALIATRELHNEEVFMNYRFNPNLKELPKWYHDCDPESSARRWKSTPILM